MKRAIASDCGAEGSRTLADVTYQRLKSDIIWGRLAPNAPLRSDRLRIDYDVGISPLREALTRLANEALVTSSGQRGFRVASLNAADVRDTADTRVVIEGEALRRAMDRGDLDWETGIVGATHALTRTIGNDLMSPEGEAWSIQHRRFHLALIGACGSEWMLRLSMLLFDHSERHRLVAEHRRITIEAAGAISRRNRIKEHEDLAQIVLSRDSEGALSAISRHYMLTAEFVVGAIDEVSHKRAVAKNDALEVTKRRIAK